MQGGREENEGGFGENWLADMSGNEGASVVVSDRDPDQFPAMRCDAMRCDGVVFGTTYPGLLQRFHVFLRKPGFSLLSPA